MSKPISTVTINSHLVNVDLAQTESARNKGLSGRDSMPENSGMLFVFEKPGLYQFWMKDMQFPLDFLWITADGKISEITANVSPDTYPGQTFASQQPSLYVLELNAGWAAKNLVKVGDQAIVDIK